MASFRSRSGIIDQSMNAVRKPIVVGARDSGDKRPPDEVSGQPRCGRRLGGARPRRNPDTGKSGPDPQNGIEI
jgi:hypothetical protein